MRAVYDRWLKNGKSPDAFPPKWKAPYRRLKIQPEQAVRYTRRVIAQGITISELYRRLSRENGGLDYSLSNLYRVIPSKALREVQRARIALAKAEREALVLADARAKGNA
jgi:hypothetical protein